MHVQFRAVLWDVPTCIDRSYGEEPTRLVFRRGCFADVLAAGARPALVLNHDSALPLDVRRMGLWEDSVGLAVDADVEDDDVVAALLAKAVRLNRVYGASCMVLHHSDRRYDWACSCWAKVVYRVEHLLDVTIMIARGRPNVAQTAAHVRVW